MAEGGEARDNRLHVSDFIPVLKDKLGIEAPDVWIMKRSDSVFAAGKKHKTVPYLEIKAKQADYDQLRLENNEYFYFPQQTYGEDAAKHVLDIQKERIAE